MEGASTKHVDEETNQEMHKASMQGMGLQLDIKFAISLLTKLILYTTWIGYPISSSQTNHTILDA